MSTLEATVSMLEVLPEADLIRIQNFARNLLLSQDSSYPFQPLTKAQIIAQLDESRSQYEAGNYQEAVQFSEDLVAKYGL